MDVAMYDSEANQPNSLKQGGGNNGERTATEKVQHFTQANNGGGGGEGSCDVQEVAPCNC